MILITIFTVYIVLDTFVLSTSYETAVSDEIIKNMDSGEATSNDNSYEDDNIEITINEYRENSTTIYVADIKLKDSSYLQTAFASNTYGKNITEKTSTIAETVNAILAINGDYYGVQQRGYVLKNGKIYRETSNSKEDLVIYKDGSWKFINEDEVTLQELVDDGAYNILSFGPALVLDSSVAVDTNDEVDKAMKNNPRTAIGKLAENHYVFVVSDGRTNKSTGLTLYELANFMKELGCTEAYNLDGGGLSTMYFNGNVINNPTTNGNRISERSVSDIVYIGY